MVLCLSYLYRGMRLGEFGSMIYSTKHKHPYREVASQRLGQGSNAKDGLPNTDYVAVLLDYLLQFSQDVPRVPRLDPRL